MSFYFPEGSVIYVSPTFGAAIPVNPVTNAVDALCTANGHGLVDNDEVLYLPTGWEDANNSVFRVDQQDANTFKLLGLDTTDLTRFPAGQGVGTVQKISGWLALPQVLDIQSQGGDARFTPVGLLASRNDISIPTGFNPANMQVTMAHDPNLAAYKSIVAISRKSQPVAVKMVIGGGATIYGYGFISVSEVPQLQRQQVNRVTAGLSINGRIIGY